MTTNDLSRLKDLEVRLYTLTTRSHLRVGAGEGTADVATDNPIIRALVFGENDSEKRVPYIPGSSLHGVIRAWVEKALRSGQEPLNSQIMQEKLKQLDEENRENLRNEAKSEAADFLGIKLEDVDDQRLFEHWPVYVEPHVCNPLSSVDKCEQLPRPDANQKIDKKVEWWQTIGRQPPCDVCRIFGYMGQRGRVKFSHAWPTTENLPLDVITRVAINRLTGAADEGKLFDMEAIPPGVSFHFFTVLENMQGDKTNFEMGLKALNLQLAGLGAHSTVGFGMVDIEQTFKVKISPQIFSRNVELEFINKMLPSSPLDGFDKDKVPKFFQALVAAHRAGGGQYVDGLIEFI